MVVRGGGPDYPPKRTSHRAITKQLVPVRRVAVVEDSFGQLQRHAGVKSGHAERSRPRGQRREGEAAQA